MNISHDTRPEIYAIQEYGEIGVVPRTMHAWVIKKNEFGEPEKALVRSVVPVPEIDDNQVLVRVMAVGVNFNTIWAGLGKPISVFSLHNKTEHIPGSDASGIVWKVGKNVKHCKVGDEVIVTCFEQCLDHGNGNVDNPNFNSFDPMSSLEHGIMGYETPDGSSCQFVAVQGQQILPKPKHLTWEDAASYVLTYFTAYRMLVQRCKLRPGQLVLVWGGAGGLGVYAIQLCREWGADAIAVVSSDEKGEYCQSLGAMGYINRNSIKGYRNEDGEDPKHNPLKKVMKPFQRKIWEICGCQRSPDIVFEHPGKQTFALSVFLAARFGKIVICGATSGYDLTFDARHLWMHQKQIIGSHYANFLDCRQGNTLITKNKIQIINNHTYSFDEFALAHQDLYEHKVLGNTSILIFPDTVKGLKTRAEIEAQFKA